MNKKIDLLNSNLTEEIFDYSNYTDEEKEQIKQNNIEAIGLCKQLKRIFGVSHGRRMTPKFGCVTLG